MKAGHYTVAGSHHQEVNELLHSNELEEFTFSYVLLCLLHLANEQMLHIEAFDIVLDYLIIQLMFDTNDLLRILNFST